MASKQWFGYEGRLPRMKFWIGMVLLMAVHTGVSQLYLMMLGDVVTRLFAIIGMLIWMGLALIVSLSFQIRRWHDRDKSGLWVLIVFIPILGAVWSLVELGFLRGTVGPNEYGIDPLEPDFDKHVF